jgi:hypothetical protein
LFLVLVVVILSMQFLATTHPACYLSSFAFPLYFQQQPTDSIDAENTLSSPLEKPPSREEVEAILLDTPRAEKAREWSLHYTSKPHPLG